MLKPLAGILGDLAELTGGASIEQAEIIKIGRSLSCSNKMAFIVIDVKQGAPICFLKLAVNRECVSLLEDEVKALTIVNSIEPHLIASLPKVLATRREKDMFVFATTNLSGKSLAEVLKRKGILCQESLSTIQCLAELHRQTTDGTISLAEIYDVFYRRWHARIRETVLVGLGIVQELDDRTGRLLEQYGDLRVAKSLQHMDFNPYNIIVGERVGIIDWEDAREAYPGYFDVMHFVNIANHICGHSSVETFQRVRSNKQSDIAHLLDFYMQESGSDVPLDAIELLFIYYLHFLIDRDISEPRSSTRSAQYWARQLSEMIRLRGSP